MTRGALLALVFLVAYCRAQRCPGCSGFDEAPAPGDFAFNFLVRQWPNEFCHIKNGCWYKPKPAAGFTIHGLWPNLDNYCQKDFPQHCVSDDGFDTFNIRNIKSSTKQQLKRDWPSYTGDSSCFWEHEWDCHGSCTNLSQQDYFQKTLDLHVKYNISRALAKKGIVPSNTPVQTERFLAALTSDFGAAPLLFCNEGGNRDYIFEIFMCFTKELELVDCDDVCLVERCDPGEPKKCDEELVYKLGPIQDKDKRDCTPSFRECEQKSGTCKPQNSLFDASA